MSSANPLSVSDSDTDEESDPNLPSRDECESRCQSFAEITGTDTALAMFYLQDRQWNVDRALNDYYAAKEGDRGSDSDTSPEEPLTRRAASPRPGMAGKTLTESKLDKAAYLTTQPPVAQQRNEKRIRVLSWNVDGLDPDNLQSRTEGMCSVLLQEAPEIIFLQEVVDRSLKIIQERCVPYLVLPCDELRACVPGAYFTAMLLRKDCVCVKSMKTELFPTTVMSRSLMSVKCEVKDIALTLMTSHLESTAEYSSERKKQLAMCFDRMMNDSRDQTVIFGGDLNLREKELHGLSAKPTGVYDIWECSGKRPEAQYTWDLTINDNKQMGTKFQPRCRFDRMYIRHAGVAKVSPVYFELVGIQRLASCRRFPSDHWGIFAHFDIVG